MLTYLRQCADPGWACYGVWDHVYCSDKSCSPDDGRNHVIIIVMMLLRLGLAQLTELVLVWTDQVGDKTIRLHRL